jgi:biotin operon repressor
MKKRVNKFTSTLSMTEAKKIVLTSITNSHAHYDDLAKGLGKSTKYVLSLVTCLRAEGHKIRSIEGYLFID